MADDNWQDVISTRIKLAQIMVAGMATGCLVFLAIVLVMPDKEAGPGGDETVSLVTYLAVAVAAASTLVRLVVPAALITRSRENIVQGKWQLGQGRPSQAGLEEFLKRTGDAGRLWLVYLTQTAISTAVLEGGVFVCLIAYLLDRSVLTLAVAIALVIALVLHFPTRSTVMHWIEDQLRIIDHQRELGR